jgi:hypothetical protein
MRAQYALALQQRRPTVGAAAVSVAPRMRMPPLESAESSKLVNVLLAWWLDLGADHVAKGLLE